MNYCHYILLIGIFFTYSCSKPKLDNNEIIKVDLSVAKPMNMSDFVKEITLLPLETLDSCLIKRINQLEVSKNYIFINNDMSEVLVFDKNGRFITSTISKKGQGPDDYLIVANMDITNDELISIFDGNTIYEYDVQMNLVDKQKIVLPEYSTIRHEMPRHLKLNEDTYIIKDGVYTYFYSVRNDSIISYKKNFYHPHSWTGVINSLRFLKHNKKIYFSPTHVSDTLYQMNIQQNQLEPIVIYDAGDWTVDLDELPQDMNIQYYSNYLFETDKFFLSDKIHLPYADFAFLHRAKDNKSYISYKRKLHNVEIYKNGEQHFPIPHTVYKNVFVYAAMPDKLYKYIDSTLIKEKVNFANISEFDNHILVCYILNED